MCINKVMNIMYSSLAAHELMCVFKSLKQTPDGTCKTISWDGFSGLYENLGLKWEMVSYHEYSLYSTYTFTSN